MTVSPISNQRPLSRNRVKTRTGCLRCKQRRIKCDETHPHCNQCTRRAYDCPGYKRPLKWSAKYEVAGDAGGHSKRAGSLGPVQSASKCVSKGWETAATLPASSPGDSVGSTRPDGRDAEAQYTISPHGSFPDFGLSAGEITHNNSASSSQSQLDSSITLLNIRLQNDRLSQELESSIHGLIDWPEFSLQVPPPLEDQDTMISRHYFSNVCRINSCFDSDANFFRVEIGNLMTSCPLVYHCVLSMSAAHRGNMVTSALDHRARAISCLTSEVTKIKGGRRNDAGSAMDSPFNTLLGSILLGMTDAWHNPSFLGTNHLHGARELFKRWMPTLEDNATASLPPTCSSRSHGFTVGIMAYWEAVASFLTNQSLDAISYLNKFCDQDATTRFHPNPWTGICTPLFIYLARAGTLTRQRSLIKHISVIAVSAGVQNQLESDVLRFARDTEIALLRYKTPGRDRIEDTGDPLTPVSHLQMVAQIYRLVALLELYKNFPELLTASQREGPNDCGSTAATASSHHLTPAAKIRAMATATLTLIAAIPRTSGVNCVLTIPLLVTGSSLEATDNNCSEPDRGDTSWDTLSTEILSTSSQAEVNLYWRDFVRERIQAVHSYVGVAAISRAMEILEKSWARSDIQAAVEELDTNTGLYGGKGFVQWVDVMVDEKLETILG